MLPSLAPAGKWALPHGTLPRCTLHPVQVNARNHTQHQHALPLTRRSYNNLICDAGIKRDAGDAGPSSGASASPGGASSGGASGATPSPPAQTDGGSGLGLDLGLGLDWQKLMNAKAVVCDPVPTEVATCGSGVRRALSRQCCALVLE